MALLDRYLIRRVMKLTFAITLVALLALMLERMLRVLELAANSRNLAVQIAQIMGSLTPHYLGLALPTAFFLAIVLTLQRASRSQELAAYQSAGIGLARTIAPMVALAGVMMMIVIVLFGWAQPHTRYAYRAMVHSITAETVEAAVRQGAFVTIGDRTLYAEQAGGGSERLDQVFVFDRSADGTETVLTSPGGTMRPAADGMGSDIVIQNGQSARFAPDGALDGVISFGEAEWNAAANPGETFRPRGDDARELTLTELFSAIGEADSAQEKNMLQAEFHGRLARIVMVLILPVFAAPLAVNAGRSEQTAGLGVGLILLITGFQILELGESFAAEGMTVLLALWAPIFIFAAVSAALFHRVAYTPKDPPLFAATLAFNEAMKSVKARLKRRKA